MVQVADSEDNSSPSGEKYRLYRYRYVTVAIFALAAVQNVLMWLVFGPLQTSLATMYDIKLTTVVFGTILIANIVYIPANFIGTSLIDTYGLRFGVILGSVLNLIGLWLRYFCEHSFAFIFVGQFFGGISQPFFYSTPQKVSSVWFGPNERTMATTVILIACNVGNAVGAFLPQFFVDTETDDTNLQKRQMRNMMLWLAILGSVVTVVTVIFFREKPPTPPSKGAKAVKYGYLDSLKSLFKDYNAMLFIIASSASSGAMFNYGTVIQQLVYSFNITPVQVGNILTIGVILGFFGSGAAGYFVFRTKKFKMSIIFLCFICTAMLVANYFAAKTGNPYLFGACFCIFNTAIVPVMPLSLEAGVELSFPVAEATSGGVWYTIDLALSTGLSYAVAAILDDYDGDTGPLVSYALMFGYQLVFLLMLFFVKENLKRTKYEKESLIGEPDRKKLLGKGVLSSIGGGAMMFEENHE